MLNQFHLLVETFNPGNSVKDRMALKMIEDAEETGIANAKINDK